MVLARDGGELQRALWVTPIALILFKRHELHQCNGLGENLKSGCTYNSIIELQSELKKTRRGWVRFQVEPRPRSCEAIQFGIIGTQEEEETFILEFNVSASSEILFTPRALFSGTGAFSDQREEQKEELQRSRTKSLQKQLCRFLRKFSAPQSSPQSALYVHPHHTLTHRPQSGAPIALTFSSYTKGFSFKECSFLGRPESSNVRVNVFFSSPHWSWTNYTN